MGHPEALTSGVGTGGCGRDNRPVRHRVPPELKRGVFTTAQALHAGVDRWQLNHGPWRRVAHGFYVWRGIDNVPETRLDAALLRLPSTAVFSGLTAAWLHGLEVEPCRPIEVTLPGGGGVSGRAGMSVGRIALAADDVVTVRGYPATSICRTLRDLSRRLGLVETVVQVDAALQARLVEMGELESWIASRYKTIGISALRKAFAHAEPLSESPMETRLRMLLVLRAVARPLAQVTLTDEDGEVLGRPDLYYPEQRLGLEYDGGTHRDSLVEDNRRQNRLAAAGVLLLRFTAGDVYGAPDRVAAYVQAMLIARTHADSDSRLPAKVKLAVANPSRLPANVRKKAS